MTDYQFFATPGDLAPGWEAVKNIVDFKFVKQGYRDNPNWPIYRSILDIPELGHASSSRIFSSGAYIILPSNAQINIKKYKEDHKKSAAYHFDTEYFYGVHFLPYHRSFDMIYLGGLWIEKDVTNLLGYNMFSGDEDNILNAEFLSQFKIFCRLLMKGFKTVKIKQFGQWKVGPEAYEMFQNGTRLIGYDASPHFENNIGALDPNIYK